LPSSDRLLQDVAAASSDEGNVPPLGPHYDPTMDTLAALVTSMKTDRRSTSSLGVSRVSRSAIGRDKAASRRLGRSAPSRFTIREVAPYQPLRPGGRRGYKKPALPTIDEHAAGVSSPPFGALPTADIMLEALSHDVMMA
jgi:hypothetical protein